MFATTIILAISAIAPLVSAHGKVAVITGDLGGNGTAFGIKGASVAGAGQNYQTEIDTTVFWSKSINTDNDLGYTEDGTGNNQLSDLASAMALSGSTLPQVSSTGGSVSGTFHIVTTDGAGPLSAVVDATGTGKFSTAATADVTTQVPGTNGNIAAPTTARSIFTRMLMNIGVINKRAENVNEDYPFAIAIPAGTTCTGTINGQSNVCLVKVSNLNAAGPFGGVFAVQMPNSTTSARVKRSTKFTRN